MTENAPDDKTPAAEDAVDESAAEAATTADEAEDAVAETAPSTPAAKPAATTKPKPAPAGDEDEEETEVVPVTRRRPPRPATATAPSAPSTPATVAVTVLVIALVAATTIFGFLYFKTRGELNDQKAADADRAHAEKVATDYATGASTFDYRDLGPWSKRLTTGVSTELKQRFEPTVGAMNQLLQPLQWVSKGTVTDAVVSSQSGSIYKVNAYVNVDMTNAQVPSGRTTLTVYNVTINKDANWEITDVGGTGAAPGIQSNEQTPAPAPAPTETAPAPAPAGPGN
ncbi:Mce-associated membrane protein OS=Tsukamurella paurometabola (strain ATCC 8368 / DSM / CCUG 35730 / CIP 100753 / JCM 10117 / KCTC 9821 / NBRC 16120 / NCIMB 702349 / NCTC 13040) OX=521096 GN=Tpau_1239 PE=4 SV=1 [Tsukamurella paurometabola]|uniref:Mce-associated membrane protein n=1 Tax=Tsukamurella paurometabola (strain ATCC 8368 / DSM 20162 / CCUG 35730 / CIP 100753 / JCM 10117 / KCTC 9821 / NBRC 16120 / NCIMB 702349 / NCTC 13040) TaxID=521096 RepID=D5UW63_TSUPD|nr:hypothetical protein [Tsukamurella paurometabola]ADG77870.1 hypothetical protein Tpau_1239 [Tsukamurella paurometabola DSM 20162]SUP29138.1 Uncharacterised protein [Tsukamurella paurometabola]